MPDESDYPDNGITKRGKLKDFVWKKQPNMLYNINLSTPQREQTTNTDLKKKLISKVKTMEFSMHTKTYNQFS